MLQKPNQCIDCKCRSYKMCEEQTYRVMPKHSAQVIFERLCMLAVRVEQVILHGYSYKDLSDFRVKKPKKFEVSQRITQDVVNKGLTEEQLQQITMYISRKRMQGYITLSSVQVTLYYARTKITLWLPINNDRLRIRYKLAEWCDGEVTKRVNTLALMLLQ